MLRTASTTLPFAPQVRTRHTHMRRTLIPMRRIQRHTNTPSYQQTTEGCRTLAEGSVLCLDDRTPLGRVEDVFGPVKSPFYALRYYAGDGLPASVAPGSAVFSVDRYADMLVPDKLKAKGCVAAQCVVAF